MFAGRCFALLLAIAALPLSLSAQNPQTLQALSADFWQWRASEQPFSTDDIPRIERPASFTVDWSPKTIATRKTQLAAYERRWQQAAPPPTAPIPEKVDYRLLGSAIARVRWELLIEQTWRRDPQFYIDQTLGSVVALLLEPPPFSPERQREIILRLRQIPATLQAAEANLTDIRAPFATLAITALDDIATRTHRAETALAPYLTDQPRKDLQAATPAAIAALEQYRTWLQSKLPAASTQTAIGRENYLYFLHNVALLPYTPEQLLAMSRQEWARAVAFETYQQQRLANTPPTPIFPSAETQIAAEQTQETNIRRFLEANQLLTIPARMPHYRFQSLPAYLAPFSDITETDDFPGPSRLTADATRYITPPSPTLGFFSRSMAQDPRSITVHEGVPGHFFQLALGWHNPDPIRRHYYDSGANEGIGFYTEEMLLQAGLFDDKPPHPPDHLQLHAPPRPPRRS